MLPYKDQSPIDREEKAKALLKEAGYGPGKPLTVENPLQHVRKS